MASKTIDFIMRVKGNAETQLKSLSRSAAGADRDLRRVAKSSEDAGSKLASLGGVIGGIPIPGFEALGRATTAAGDSIEALANPVGASIVLIGGLGAAAAASAVGVYKLVSSADDWLDALKKAQKADDLVTKSEIAQLFEANEAIDAVATAAQRLGVVLAVEFSPAVRKSADSLTGLLSIGERLFKNFGDGSATLSLIDASLSSLASQSTKATVAIQSLRAAFSAASAEGERLRNVKLPGGLSAFETAVSGRLQDRAAGLTGGGLREAAKLAGERGREAMNAPTAEERRIAAAIELLGRTVKSLSTSMSVDLAPAIDQLPDSLTGTMEDLEINIPETSLRPMIDALDKQREDAARNLMNATSSTEGLVRAIPVIGNIMADIGKVALNLPSFVNGLRKDLVEGPRKLGMAFQKTMTNAIPKLVESLPQIFKGLFLDLPAAIARGVVLGIPKIFAAYFRMLGEQIKKALLFFKGGEDRNILTGRRGKVLGTSFKKDDFSIFGIGNRRRDNVRGSFATGGFVPETGLYRLHKNEFVQRPGSSRPSAADRMMRDMPGGGMLGGATINVYPTDYRDFIRQLRRELGPNGTGASLTPR